MKYNSTTQKRTLPKFSPRKASSEIQNLLKLNQFLILIYAWTCTIKHYRLQNRCNFVAKSNLKSLKPLILLDYSIIVATRPEPTVRPPSRSDFAYLETYLLWFLPFFDSFYGYFTYYFGVFRKKRSNSVSRIQENPLCITSLCPCQNNTVSVHLGDIVAWSNRNVKWFFSKIA